MDEALPYLEHRRRQLLFRECVLSFFGVPPLGTADRDDDDYAAAVKSPSPPTASASTRS